MAMYTNTKGWINSIELKTSKNGLEYTTVEICIQSKRKDKYGEYTIYETPCFITARVFSKTVLEKLFTYKTSLLVQLDLKLESVKKDDSYYQNWILLGFSIVDTIIVTEMNLNSNNAEKIANIKEEAHITKEEMRQIILEDNVKEHPVVC